MAQVVATDPPAVAHGNSHDHLPDYLENLFARSDYLRLHDVDGEQTFIDDGRVWGVNVRNGRAGV